MKKDAVIREAFLDAFRSQGVSVQKVRDLAEAQSDPYRRSLLMELGKSHREVYGIPNICLMNIHIKSEPPGWWNTMKSVVEHFTVLSTLPIKCYS